jgi:hypothetical protein
MIKKIDNGHSEQPWIRRFERILVFKCSQF